MMAKARREDGFTLVEVGIAMLLGAILLTLATTLVVVAYRTGAFTQGQGFTLNDARNAMQGMEREVRGAGFINWCSPAGSCLEVGAQTPSAGFQTLRYTHSDDALQRQVYDESSSTWSEPQPVIERVANTGSEPVFACDTQSTLLRVNIDLKIKPTPASDPVLNLYTSVRPRNFPSKARCPSL